VNIFPGLQVTNTHIMLGVGYGFWKNSGFRVGSSLRLKKLIFY